MTGPYPEPHPSAGIAAHASWEREIGRRIAQALKHRGNRAGLERRYGKGWEQLTAIAERNGVRVAKQAQRRRKRA